MAVKIKAEGTLKDYEKIVKQMPQILGNLLDQTALKLDGEAKKEVPVDTGFLKNSHQISKTGNFSRKVAATADYAAYVHYGTRYQKANPWMQRARNTTERWLRSNGAKLIKLSGV